MNIYFLVEGRRTEKKVYPQWLSYLTPTLKQVHHFDEVENDNYYLFSSNGYPSILEDIKNAIQDINNCGKYSYLVICLDADECTAEERRTEVQQVFQTKPTALKAKPVIIVQNRCFETWFLGNRKAYPRKPQNGVFREYCSFYNVSQLDPELMPGFSDYDSVAQFHADYLKQMLLEKGIHYTKKNPREVTEPHYIKALQKRITETPTHLKSLQEFFDFCKTIR